MTNQTKYAAILMAGVSMLALAPAYADQAANLSNLQVADASIGQPEMLSVTAADPQGGNAGGAPTNVGSIDVQGAGTAVGSGYIVPEDGAKGRSTVTHQGINNLLPTANPFQAISILPGVNQFQDDAVGMSGGTIRVRGMRADQMGFTINGAPVNDSGNFAIFPQEYVDTENLAQVWVSQGSTDIDAPHVGATGGNIGIVMRAPSDTFNVRVEQAAGELDYAREFISLDTGWMGKFKGFVSISQADVDKWRGEGTDNRFHIDTNLLYQFAPHSSIALQVVYNSAFDNFYRSYGRTTVNGTPLTAEQFFQQFGSNFDYDTFWNTSAFPLHFSGKGASSPTTNITNPNFPPVTTNMTNYWPLQINPFKNAVVTIPLHVELSDNLRWETDGYMWWGYGGGGFGNSATEGGFINGYQVPVGYGDAAGSTNTMLMYKSSVTRTLRPGFTSKLVYDMDNWTLTAGIWAEHAEHRQTAPYSFINPNGKPCDAWLTELNATNGCVMETAAGSIGASGPIQGRDFLTASVGSAVFGEAQGRFFDDALKVNVGLSYRNIQRSMHDYLPICAVGAQYCGNGANPTLASTLASATWINSSAYQFFGAPTIGSAAAYAAMQKFAANPHADFHALLPEVNFTFDLNTNNQIFGGEMRGYRSPSNFIFNSFNSSTFNNTTAQVLEITNVKSETNWTYEAGYRYHDDFLTASTTLYLHDFSNYQASVQLDPVDFSTANIGSVKIYGIEAEAGTAPWHGFTFYGSGTLQNSRLGSDLSADSCQDSSVVGCTAAQKNFGPPNVTGVTQLFVNTKGKRLVDTPNWLISASIGYSQDGFFGAITPHCNGDRPTSLLNDEYLPSSCTVDATVGYRFDERWGPFKDATLQLFAANIVNSRNLGEITTQAQTNAKAAAAYSPQAPGQAFTVPGQSYSAYPVAPVFVGVKLNINLGH
ncbi:MAG TPA: TonB-dependent receptor [Rhizomicrobium sp.]|nr:TonB-dependent receptor [Rhizomicrobium sp.]